MPGTPAGYVGGLGVPLIPLITMNGNGSKSKGTNLSELAADYRLLESARCRCSSVKGIGEALCGACWSRLPESHHRALRSARPAFTFRIVYCAATAFLDNLS